MTPEQIYYETHEIKGWGAGGGGGPLLAWAPSKALSVSLGCILFLQVDPPKQHNNCCCLQRGTEAWGDQVATEGHPMSGSTRVQPGASLPPPQPSPSLGATHA